MSSRTNALGAIVVSLLPLLALTLLDHANARCGDGMCSFFSGILVLGALAVATLVFLVRSARRNETPAFLRVIPLVLWILALAPLMI